MHDLVTPSRAMRRTSAEGRGSPTTTTTCLLDLLTAAASTVPLVVDELGALL
jgi:hypothetical protein